MSARKVRATVDFRPRFTDIDGNITEYVGTILSPIESPVIDQQTGQKNPKYICRVTRLQSNYISRVTHARITHEWGWMLTTQGPNNGGRRYRYGTYVEMMDAAEKWVARRFYSEQEAITN